MNIFNITWYGWHNVWLFPLFVVAALLMWWQTKKRYHAIRYLTATQHQGLLLRNWSLYKSIIKLVLFYLGLCALFIALLRPAWGIIEYKVEQEGRDLLIAIDVSRSMLAQDLLPNRLEFAKKKIRQLVQKLTCERVGLLLFSGSAFIQCPLTKDYATFFMFLDQLDAETISSGSTAIDQAIKKALDVYQQVSDRKNKLLVIFTDGEDFSSNLAGIKARALELGLTLFTIGLGTVEGAPIPIIDEHSHSIDHLRDAKGAVVITKLNEGILKALSDATGGIYLKAAQDDTDIVQLIKRVHGFEKERLEEQKISKEQDRYYIFAALSFLCFALEWLL